MRVPGMLAPFILVAAALSLFWTGNAVSEEGQKTDFSSKSIDDYIEKMEVPRRAEWQKPEKVVDSLQIKDGDKVADIGAGTGYFAVIFSKRVGDKGKVYAVDVEKKLLEYIEFRARKGGLSNIECVLSPPDDPHLPKASMDLVFIGNTYVYIDERDKYLKKLKDVLKEGGRLAVVDYHIMNNKPGSPPPHRRIAREKVLEDALKAGFKLEAEYFFLPYQYFLVFTK